MRTYTLDGKKLPLKGDVKPACETCRFFIHNLSSLEDITLPGTCHRHAPVGEPKHWWGRVWPNVATSDWCGEYEEAAQAVK